MKDYLIERLRQAPTQLAGRNLLREYLQARILEALQQSGAMISLAFLGGTALRFLYDLPRHSEDLDFSLERGREGFDFRAILRGIVPSFAREAYSIDIKVKDQGIVQSASVRFPGLLHEVGLSVHPGEVLSVKIEVDTRPPEGAIMATRIVRRHVLLHLQHHDRASLLAGKLHAVLTRPYAKGRDLYDLLWYLSDRSWPAPNIVFLRNALAQTGWVGPEVTGETWREVVRGRVGQLDWSHVVDDVSPFIERPAELVLLTRENVVRVLDG